MRRRGRILSLLLVICLAAGMLPATAFAVPETTRTARTAGRKGAVQLVDTDNPSGGIKGYDSESKTYDYIYYGIWENWPIRWRVLDDRTNMDSKGLFVLSETAMPVYSLSDSTTIMNGWCKYFSGEETPLYPSENTQTAFSQKELDAVLSTMKTDEKYTFEYGQTEYSFDAASLNNARVFLLSAAEASNPEYGFSESLENSDLSRRAYTFYTGGERLESSWWLRSCGRRDSVAAKQVGYVTAGGGIQPIAETATHTSGGVHVRTTKLRPRPAFNLDTDKVLFTAPAASKARAAGGLEQVAEETPSEWKLTLKDDGTGSGRENFKAELSGESSSAHVPGERLNISYSGAKTGDNESISAMIVDGDKNVLYYGQICPVADAGSGTAQITIPARLPGGSYTLKVFNEQCNGAERTNYASDFSNIPIAVKDDDPPVVKEERVVRLSGEKATVTFTSNEAGTYYYKVAEEGSTPPEVDTTGSGKSCSTEEETISLDNLENGKAYKLSLVVKDTAGNESAPLTVDIPKEITPVTSISVDPVSLDFGSVEENYEAVPEKKVTIENTGNQSVTLTQPPALKNYVVGSLSPTELGEGEKAEFTVRPKAELAIGTYPEEIVVSGSSADGKPVQARIPVAFEVKEEVRYSISVDPKALDFGSAAEGYEQPEAKTITVKNTGNQKIHLNKNTETARYDDRPFSISSFEDSKLLLQPEETASFTVQPKAGLSKGTYKETITISGSRRTDDATAEVTAEFTVTDPSAKTYTITAKTEGEGGSITPASAQVAEGESATFTVTPEEGYEVEKVLVDGTEDVTERLSDKGEYTFQNVEQDHTIEATFKEKGSEPAVTHTVSVSANPEAGGTAAVPGGGVSGTYNEGSRVLVTATANTGYRFVRWTENGNTVSESASYEFDLTADRNLVAVFEAESQTPTPASHTVTVNSSYAQTPGAGTYQTGATVTIQAGTRQNYRFDGWTTEDGVTFANANSATTTFTMPDKNVTVSAKWTYTGSTGTGSGTNSGTGGTTSGNNNTTSGTTSGTGTSGGKEGVYTGDDTPTAMWISTLCTSFGLMTALAVLYLRQRKLSGEFAGQWRGLTEREFGQKRR